ncbi:hypothetical protein [Streptomyces sp. NPDC019937]|uniref:hypothetical protein n=1 Tax=Streptomyces sp. NPDC019937 TaxID=3154787 RepID=UPI003405C45B
MITVRQLLQHTSGVPDILDYLSPRRVLEAPPTHYDTRDLVNARRTCRVTPRRSPDRTRAGTRGRAYGLGLESRPLPCGGRYWGRSGDILGYETVGGATDDGRQATVMVNVGPGGSDGQSDGMKATVEAALCENRPWVSP